MYILYVAIIACACVCFTLQRNCWRLIWQLNGIRGIVQQPFLWSLLIYYREPHSILDGMQRWRNYFKRPFGIIFGAKILLYVDDPFTIEQILTAHQCQDKTFLQNGFFARKGLLHARGQQWKIRRKQLNPAFGHNILLSFFHIFNCVGNQLQKAFSGKLQGTAAGVLSYKDVEDIISRAVLEVSCQTTLGIKTNFTTNDADGIARTYKKLLEISALRIMKPWLQNDRIFRLLDRRNYDAYVTCNKSVQHFVENIVQRKHQTWLAEKLLRQEATEYSTSNGENYEKFYFNEKRIFIEQIFHLAEMGEMTLDDIINETHSMILVSFETVSNSLVIALLLLAMHPDCQRKLRCEIEAIFSNERVVVVDVAKHGQDEDGTPPPPRFQQQRERFTPDDDDEDDASVNIYEIDATQLQQMKYLDMIVNESLRLLTTVPINLRNVSSEFQLRLRNTTRCKANMTDFIALPRNTIIVVDTFNMQRDSSNWGPKAHEFIPEHFATDQAPHRHPYAFIPFSKGLRSCIGWRYSELLMKIFLVKLISSFEFRIQTQLTQLRFIQGISLKFHDADSITFQICQLNEKGLSE